MLTAGVPIIELFRYGKCGIVKSLAFVLAFFRGDSYLRVLANPVSSAMVVETHVVSKCQVVKNGLQCTTMV